MSPLLIVGIVVGSLLVLICAYLATIIFGPVLRVTPQPFDISLRDPEYLHLEPTCSREDISFKVDGDTVTGWLYLPEDCAGPLPCIVMNHGFGGTKDMGLERYANHFIPAGFAVLTYDYRHFGVSEGSPRQLFSMEKQLDDCRGAIAYARNREEIDPGKIIIWGTSGAGGYGLIIAADDARIACVSAQCAAFDHKADTKVALDRDGIWFYLRLVPHAQRDKGRARFGLSPHTIPIVGRQGTGAILAAPGAFEGYSRFATPESKNELCARLMLTHQGYNPIDFARDVRCPVLIQICENDNLAAPSGGLKTAQILGDLAEVKQYPIGHFDIYFGEDFERGISDQIRFYKKNL